MLRGRSIANPLLSEAVQLVTIKADQHSRRQISGITAGGSARFDWGRWGEFGFGLDYNVTLDHTQYFPGDPETDLLSPAQALTAEFKTVSPATSAGRRTLGGQRARHTLRIAAKLRRAVRRRYLAGNFAMAWSRTSCTT